MTREQHKINRLLRQVKSRVERIEVMMAEPMKIEKVAIRVNNERQFKILMKRYHSNGWKWFGGDYAIGDFIPEFPTSISYMDEFCHSCGLSYTIIDFDIWAAQNGVEVRKPLLISEDGVELFEADEHHVAVYYAAGYWGYACSQRLHDTHMVIDNPKEAKAFKSKEAAESWIQKANKPKFKDVPLFLKGNKAVVFKDRIEIYDCERGFPTTISPSDIEDILQAYNSLHQ